jgi:hypothetical protein
VHGRKEGTGYTRKRENKIELSAGQWETFAPERM